MGRLSWHILFVGADRKDYFLLREMLASAGREDIFLERASSFDQGCEYLQARDYDAVLVDYDLGSKSGIRLIRECRAAGTDVPMILLAGPDSYEVDIEAMQAGAAGYLNKADWHPRLLERSIRYAIRYKRIEHERGALLKENRLQRDLLERIMEDSLTAIAVLQGPEHRYIRANPVYHEIAGKDELVGRTVAEVWPEVAGEFIPLLDRVFQSGEPFSAVEMPFPVLRDRELEPAYDSFNYSPLFGPNNQVEGIVVMASDTTGQVASRETLRVSESMLRSFFESEAIFAGIVELHGDDIRYIWTNEKLASYFHLQTDQIAGKYGKELGIDPHTLADYVAMYRQAVENDAPLDVEYSFVYRGRESWFFETISPLLPAPGGPPRFASVAVDITERRRSEDALQRERELLQKLFDRIPIMITMYDPNLKIREFNPAFEKTLGWSPEDLQQIGADMMERFYPDPEYREAVAAYMESTVEGWRDFGVTAKDGSIVESSWSNFVLSDDTQVGIGIDLRDRKKAEQELEAALDAAVNEKNRLQAVMEALPVGVAICDEKGGVLLANKGYESVWGSKPPVTLSVDDYDAYKAWWVETGQLVKPEEWASARAVQNGEAVFGQLLEIQRFDGTRAFVINSAAPIFDAQGKVVGSTVAIVDVTERKRREEDAQFLATLGSRLLSIVEPDEVFRVVSEQLGKYYDALYCFMSEEELPAGETPIESIYCRDKSMSDANHLLEKLPQPVQAALNQGHKVVIEDVSGDPLTRPQSGFLDPAIKAGAIVILPRMDGETWVGSLAIAVESSRKWQPSEIELFTSVANLAWLSLDHARTQQRRKIAEERFRIALQNTPIVVFTQDMDLRYTWMHNPRHGYRIEQVLGKSDYDLLDPESAAILAEPKLMVLQTGQSERKEVHYQIGGQEVFYDLWLEPHRNRKGEMVGVTGAAMDITGLRRLEAAQIEQAAQVEVQRRLIQQREMERIDIARELHDGFLQEILAITYGLAEAMELDEKEARIGKLLWVKQNLVNQAQDIRTFCSELRPPTLAPFGLEKAIRSHIEKFKSRHPEITIRLRLDSDRQTLPEDTRMALFRAYQEAINNVAKHAHAGQAWVRFFLDDREVRLEVEDDGVGFEVPQDWVAQARTGQLGLIGIRERVQSVNGQVLFDSQLGRGTLVQVSLPRTVSQSSDLSQETSS